MNTTKKQIVLAIIATFISVSSAKAIEIPDYITDINDVSANINLIIERLSSKAGSSAVAEEDAEYFNGMKRKLASELYAQALTKRLQLIEKDKAKAKAKAKESDSKDERDIIANNVQPMVYSIGERLNDIVSLEAGIANLEGTIMITSMPKSDTDIFSDKGD